MDPLRNSKLRFAVLGELAHGGMGRVDLAKRLDGDGELLAVKRIHAHLASEDQFVRMFLDEARLTGSLHHPNVVSLVGFGSDDEGMFLATEFVRGASLAQLQRATLAAGERHMLDGLVAFVGARIATGLAAAHAAKGPDGAPLGIVHRDVSPDNVLIGFDGEVKISDFGVSKALFKSSRTATGALKGKVRYMSPEYARGEPIDGASDLFSLGVVLYTLAAGVSPFRGEHEGQVLRQILDDTPEPLSQCAPHLDPLLAGAIEQLLSKDPAQRSPGGAERTALDLDTWLERKGVTGEIAARSMAGHAQRYGAAQQRRIIQLVEGAATTTFEKAMERGAFRSAHSLTDISTPPTFDEVREDADPSRKREAPGSTRVVKKASLSLPIEVSPSSESAVSPVATAHHAAPAPPVETTGSATKRRAGFRLAALSMSGAVVLGILALSARHRTATTGSPAETGAPGTQPVAVTPQVPPTSTVTTPVSAEASPSSAPSQTAADLPKTNIGARSSIKTPRPPVHGAGPGGGPRSTSPTASPSVRPCTPDNWDYPRCLHP